MTIPHRNTWSYLLLGVLFSTLALSCKDYEYSSPLPGILEIRLKVVNSPEPVGYREAIPFGPVNTFPFLLKELRAAQPGNVRLPIYEDKYARQRLLNGDTINALDPRAENGSIILGQAYAPPGTFTGVEMYVEFQKDTIRVVRPFGGFNRFHVGPLVPTQFYKMTGTFTVNQNGLTVVTVVFNLDQVLTRRSEDFGFSPFFYVESVTNH